MNWETREVLLELALSIDSSQDRVPLLRRTLQLFLDRLGCLAAVVLDPNAEADTPLFSIPRRIQMDAEWRLAGRRAIESGFTRFRDTRKRSGHVWSLWRGQVLLVLCHHPMPAGLERDLLPIIEKLGDALHYLDERASRNRSMDLAVRTGQLLSGLGNDHRRNLDAIVRAACELTGSAASLYNRLDPTRKSLIVWAGYQLPPDMPKVDDPHGHICFEAAIKSSQGIVCLENLESSEYARTDPNVSRYGLKTYLGHPVMLHGEAIGSLATVDVRIRNYSPEDIATLQTLAHALSQEEERVFDEERVLHLNRVLTALRDVNALIVKAREEETLALEICRTLVRRRGFMVAWMSLMPSDDHPFPRVFGAAVDESGQLVDLPAFAQLRGAIAQGQLPSCVRKSLEEGGVHVFGDPGRACAGCPFIDLYPDAMGLSVGLSGDHQTLGTLTVSVPGRFARDAEEQALLREVAGDIGHALASLRSMQARRKLETEIQILRQVEEEQRYLRLFRDNPTPMVLVALPDRRIHDVNRAFLDTVGHPREQIMGRTMSEIGWVMLAEQEAAVERKFLSGQNIEDMELPFTRADSSMGSASLSGGVLKMEGKEFFLVVAIDITRRKQAEKAIEQTLNLQSLIARISAAGVEPVLLQQYLRESLTLMGQVLDVSRTYIFELNYAFSTLDNTYEWCAPGVVSQQANLRGLPFEAYAWWRSQLQENGLISYRDVAQIPDPTSRDTLTSQGILSVLVVPIRLDDHFFGFIGFDECRKRRDWSDEQVSLLKTMADVIARVIQRTREEESLRRGVARQERQSTILSKAIASPALLHGEFIQLVREVTAAIVADLDVRRAGVYQFGSSGESLYGVEGDQSSSDPGRLREWLLREMDWPERFAALRQNGFFEICDPRSLPDGQRGGEFASRDPVLGSILEVVIRSGEEVYGTLCIEHQDSRHVWEEDERAFVRLIADQLTLTLANRERNRAEAALRERDRQIREVIDNQFELVCRFTADGRLTFVNEAYCRYFGKSREELVGLRFADLVPPEEHDRMVGYLSGVSPESPVQTAQHRVVRADGQVAWMEWTDIGFFDDNGQAVYFQGSGRDVTAQRLAEERLQETNRQLQLTTAHANAMADAAERANRAKSEFLANMSHELRTPLNAILALSEALLEEVRGPLNERQKRSLENIESSGRHLLDLINDVLDLAKVEAGRMDIFPEQVSVLELCESSLAFVREQATAKGLRLHLQTDDLRAKVIADPKRMRQMLVNLLSNAVKFTPDGGEVILQTEQLQEPPATRFTVIDNGIGIPESEFEALFLPFKQLDSSLSRHHEGTGLGLVLVQRLAKLHGGSVGIASEPGKGSRFSVTIPNQIETPREPVSEPRSWHITHSVSEPITRMRALVIEDSRVASGHLTGYLEEMGFFVTQYFKGEGAVEEAIASRPNVIFLDILLPDLSGWDVLRRMRMEESLADVPVIVVSVVDEPDHALALGAARHIVKPIDRDSIGDAVRSLLRPKVSSTGQQISRHPDPMSAGSLRILMVEDNEANILAIGEYLEDMGMEVVVARDGRSALEVVETVQPDVILMDIQMPDMDGLEATRRVRQLPGLAQTPIIAVTALAMPGDRERCLAAGANAYIAKPVSLKHLVQEIRRLAAQPPG
jgi:PAS domain S-box-containing protein